jgi:hypothetical protein
VPIRCGANAWASHLPSTPRPAIGHALLGRPPRTSGRRRTEPVPNLDRARSLAVGAPVADRRDRHVEVLGEGCIAQHDSRPLSMLMLVSMTTSRCARSAFGDVVLPDVPWRSARTGLGVTPRVSAGFWHSDQISNAFRLGDQRSPSLEIRSGGRILNLRALEEIGHYGAAGKIADRLGFTRRDRAVRFGGVSGPYGSWRTVSGRFVAALRFPRRVRIRGAPPGRLAPGVSPG